MGTVFHVEFSEQTSADESTQITTSTKNLQIHASRIARDRLIEIDQSLSDWSQSSELRRHEREGLGRFQSASQLFIKMLMLSEEASKLTSGLFDITVGDSLWLGKTQTKGTLNNLQIRNQQFRFVRPPSRLTFGGIAKGYAVGEVFSDLKRAGFAVERVDGGGGNAVVTRAWLKAHQPQIKLDADIVILAASSSAQGQKSHKHVIDPLRARPLQPGLRAAVACPYPSPSDGTRTLSEVAALVDAQTKALMIASSKETTMKISHCIDIMHQWPAKAPATLPSR
jgi:thiamine biosynthesis lipoprotein ApbE